MQNQCFKRNFTSFIKPSQTKDRQLQVQRLDNQIVIRTMKCANGAGGSFQPQQPGLWHHSQQPSIRDLDSFRTLLPQAHKHLRDNSQIT